MGAFFGFIFGIWLLGMFVTWPYFWAKKTDRSQAPIVRRFTGLMWALGWPIHAVRFFMNRGNAQAAKSDLQAAQTRILGSGTGGATRTAPPAEPPRPPASNTQSSIKNPFDA